MTRAVPLDKLPHSSNSARPSPDRLAQASLCAGTGELREAADPVSEKFIFTNSLIIDGHIARFRRELTLIERSLESTRSLDFWPLLTVSLARAFFEGSAVARWVVIHRPLDVKELNIYLVNKLTGPQPLEATLICRASCAQ